jgi:nucleoid-associated protein YgaU
MSRIVAAVRFVVGIAMVAAGAGLAGPTVVALVREVSRHGPPEAVVAASAVPVQSGVGPESAAAPPAAQAAVWPPLVEPVASAGPAQLDPLYQPPTPPTPMPPVAAELGGAVPDVAAAYRSTLDVPPPPLLDGQGPPPLAAGWTAHEVAAPVTPVMPAAVVPQAYVIRDGDDLTGIATRFYGHASAAMAIWAANRQTLPDPNVLPIGATIALPPAWAMQTVRTADPRAIEPTAVGAANRPAAPAATPAARPVGWLAAGAPQPAVPPQPPPPRRPGAVRVAPGETLASLARRFYGDERMALQIWEHNRDRLRSPDLVVAGMELRLP